MSKNKKSDKRKMFNSDCTRYILNDRLQSKIERLSKIERIDPIIGNKMEEIEGPASDLFQRAQELMIELESFCEFTNTDAFHMDKYGTTLLSVVYKDQNEIKIFGRSIRPGGYYPHFFTPSYKITNFEQINAITNGKIETKTGHKFLILKE